MGLKYYTIPMEIQVLSQKVDTAMFIAWAEGKIMFAKVVEGVPCSINSLLIKLYITPLDDAECAYSMRIGNDKYILYWEKNKCNIKDIDTAIVDTLLCKMSYHGIERFLEKDTDAANCIGPINTIAKIIENIMAKEKGTET